MVPYNSSLIWAVKRNGKEGRKEGEEGKKERKERRRGRKEGEEVRGADGNDVANSMANIKQLVICT